MRRRPVRKPLYKRFTRMAGGHEQDGYRLCLTSDLPMLMNRLAKPPKAELITFTGGQNTGDPGKAMAYHGFNGPKADVVSKITNWMLAAKR